MSGSEMDGVVAAIVIFGSMISFVLVIIATLLAMLVDVVKGL